jgi:hypothetical protein
MQKARKAMKKYHENGARRRWFLARFSGHFSMFQDFGFLVFFPQSMFLYALSSKGIRIIDLQYVYARDLADDICFSVWAIFMSAF